MQYTALIAPLDWGLGHATRCIPVIQKLLLAGFKVIIAGEGDQKILIQKEFPELEFVHLTGYKLQYSSTKLRTIAKIILQIPKILIAINSENRWLRQYAKRKHLDIIIADNRYGLHHPGIISIFITHQLLIKTSLGKVTDTLIQQINYSYIKRFNECWIPDMAGEINLAGDLSHPSVLPVTPVTYIGIQSRIVQQSIPLTLPLLIILSGPEPQRSILEKIMMQQLATYQLVAVVVRGLPGEAPAINAPAGITAVNHLPAAQLQQAINAAEIIISRSGYSTIMDLLPLGKKCILIPTPGQAEQEYLASWLSYNRLACIGYQHNLVLPTLIEKARQLQLPDLSAMKHNNAIDSAISLLKKKLDTSHTGSK